jgi:thermostable 8-oxoguanine DNA glycosylase
MQQALHLSGDRFHSRIFPDPDIPLLETLEWGRFDELLTPAYWAAQSWMWELDEPEHFRLGRSINEELLACLLGGHGIPAEVGLAAYDRLRPFVGTDHFTRVDWLREMLIEPLEVHGRSVRYRFANQKARYIAGAFSRLSSDIEKLDDRSLRNALVELPGVGPKTASWVVRNARGSDQVAILDIHILWAGRTLGIFPSNWKVETRYAALEERFLAFARAIDTRPSILDSVMWMTIRRLPRSVRHQSLDAAVGSRQSARARKRGASVSTWC